MFKLFVTDDHAVLRKGILSLLANEPDFQVVGQSGSGRDTIRQVVKGDVDILVLDLGLPDISGLDVLQRVKLDKPAVKVVILTMFAGDDWALRCLNAGASGYLTKDMAPDHIVAAIRSIANGGKYLSPAVGALFMEKTFMKSGELSHQSLTNREFGIFLKLAAGVPIARIAEDLCLSPSTVSSYRLRILKKMGMANNADLVRYAAQHGLVS
ncbi:MAG: response regulator transcription factor [Magnetococcales bacterium]|nr:response regulator transcription factor [Magnetococcales bacterium]